MLLKLNLDDEDTDEWIVSPWKRRGRSVGILVLSA